MEKRMKRWRVYRILPDGERRLVDSFDLREQAEHVIDDMRGTYAGMMRFNHLPDAPRFELVDGSGR